MLVVYCICYGSLGRFTAVYWSIGIDVSQSTGQAKVANYNILTLCA